MLKFYVFLLLLSFFVFSQIRIDRNDNIENHTTLIQSALNIAAEGNKNGSQKIVVLGPGTFIVDQLVMQPQTSLVGSGGGSGRHWQGGTTIKRSAGSNRDLIVIDEKYKTAAHFVVVKNLVIDGNKSENQRGNGIHFTMGTGEGTYIEDVFCRNNPENGIKLSGGTVPFSANRLTLFQNDSAGFMIETDHSHETVVATQLSNISGDDNGLSLLYFREKSRLGYVGTVTLMNIKEECNTPGRQQSGIVLENVSGFFNIIGLSSSANKSQHSALRIKGLVTAKINVMGLGCNYNTKYSIAYESNNIFINDRVVGSWRNYK